MSLLEFYNEWKREIIGALFGFVLALPIYSMIKTFILNWWRYKKYEGQYISYLKNIPDKAHYKLKLTRSGNKFTITGNSLLGNRDAIQGEIEMSYSLINHGRGFYYHNIEGQKRKFGFYQIQLTPDDILVHQEIKNLKKDEQGRQIEIGEDCSAAYVWVKQ